MPDALDMLLALLRAIGGSNDFVTVGARGTTSYVHVVPRAVADPTNYRNRHLAVLIPSGSVAFTEPLKDALASHIAATERPDLNIDQDELGHTAGSHYGRFRWAIEYDTIVRSSGGVNGFAQLVATLLQGLN